jgi:hypothetical protein
VNIPSMSVVVATEVPLIKIVTPIRGSFVFSSTTLPMIVNCEKDLNDNRSSRTKKIFFILMVLTNHK